MNGEKDIERQKVKINIKFRDMKIILPVWVDIETVERQKKADTEVERKLDIARYKRKRPMDRITEEGRQR